MADSFVHLHVHTEYSTLDGATRIDDVLKKAKEYKMPAVGIWLGKAAGGRPPWRR